MSKQWNALGQMLSHAGTLRVSISGQTNTGNLVVGVCHRLPDKEVEDEAFFRFTCSSLRGVLHRITILVSTGKATQHGKSNSGILSSTLMIIF